MEKIDLKKLAAVWNPFINTIWIKLDKPITKEEIAEAIKNKEFIPPDAPKKMYLIWGSGRCHPPWTWSFGLPPLWCFSVR